LSKPLAPDRGLIRRCDTPMRHLHRSAPVLTCQQAECGQRVHVEPAVGRNTHARLKCAQRKFQIRPENAVTFTFVKSAAPQQRVRAENYALLQFRRRRFVWRIAENTRRRFYGRWLLSISLEIARWRRRW